MSRNRKLMLLVMTMAVGASGCSSMNNTERGALAGGGTGAVIGALVDRRSPGRGAAIGGVAGAALGAAAGNSADQEEKRIKAIAAAESAPVRGPLSLEEVADMARRGIGDEVIRTQIRTSGTRYNLSPSQISWLHDNGVSDPVITEMQQTAYRGPRTVYIERGYDPVYVVPPPRPHFYGPSFGVGFMWR